METAHEALQVQVIALRIDSAGAIVSHDDATVRQTAGSEVHEGAVLFIHAVGVDSDGIVPHFQDDRVLEMGQEFPGQLAALLVMGHQLPILGEHGEAGQAEFFGDIFQIGVVQGLAMGGVILHMPGFIDHPVQALHDGDVIVFLGHQVLGLHIVRGILHFHIELVEIRFPGEGVDSQKEAEGEEEHHMDEHHLLVECV